MAARLVAAAASEGTERLRSAEPYGLAVLGGFAVTPEHKAPEGIACIVLLGLAGDGWRKFRASPEAQDGEADPLDRWSLRVVSDLAREVGAQAFFPFGGPPYQPFLRWADATGRIWQSAIGMSIHDERGLWMAFRGALGFTEPLAFPPPDAGRPCDTCMEKPCLSACPVDAFAGGIYDTAACVAHIAGPEGKDCLTLGCRARRACPIGRDWIPEPDKAAFHMRAFKRAREADT